MTPARRRQLILESLTRSDEVRVDELADRFGVNAVTIRRDLDRLAERGQLERTHGGAVSVPEAGTVRFDFAAAERPNLPAKRAIAAVAAGLVRPGMSVSLDTGTTTLEVARQIAAIDNLQVLTSSLAVASVLYPRDNIRLVLLGGVVRKAGPDLYGQITEENLRRFRVDVGFLGADALSADGLFTTDVGVARVSEAMLAGASRSVLVADSSKFAARAFVRFAGWEDVDTLITDDALAADKRQRLAGAVRNVRVVPVKSPDEREGDNA